MAELLNAFELDIESIALVPSDGGKFEVVVDGNLVYSKLETGKHMEPGEAAKLLGKYLQDGTK